MLHNILIFWQSVWASYKIILTVQQNLFSDLHLTKFLDNSAIVFSVYIRICTILLIETQLNFIKFNKKSYKNNYLFLHI